MDGWQLTTQVIEVCISSKCHTMERKRKLFCHIKACKCSIRYEINFNFYEYLYANAVKTTFTLWKRREHIEIRKIEGNTLYDKVGQPVVTYWSVRSDEWNKMYNLWIIQEHSLGHMTTICYELCTPEYNIPELNLQTNLFIVLPFNRF